MRMPERQQDDCNGTQSHAIELTVSCTQQDWSTLKGAPVQHPMGCQEHFLLARWLTPLILT